jgi:hypothetical protein
LVGIIAGQNFSYSSEVLEKGKHIQERRDGLFVLSRFTGQRNQKTEFTYTSRALVRGQGDNAKVLEKKGKQIQE